MTPQQLKAVSLFHGMQDEEIEELITLLNGYEKHYAKDEILLHAGDTTDRLGVVLKGSVFVEFNDLWGNRTILNKVSEHGFFGEVFAMMGGTKILVDVRAETDCDVLYLQIGNLPDEVRRQKTVHELSSNLLKISMSMNLSLTTRSLHTSQRTIREKVLSYLSTCALQSGKKEFDIPFKRQELADYLCIDRSALSKELSAMQEEGIIRYRKNHFRILR